MTLPSTGPISMSMVAAELGISATGLSLNDSRVRNLAGKPSGTISMADLRGKSAVVREPASGEYYSPMSVPTYVWRNEVDLSRTYANWNGTFVGPIAGTGHTRIGPVDGWYYYRGTLRENFSNYQLYGVYRSNV